MTKLGTPIGAGPNCATVRPGLVLAGEPSGLRRVGCSIFCFSAVATCLAPWPFLACLPKRPGLLPAVVVFLPALPPPLPVVVVVLPPEPPPLPVVVVVLPPEPPPLPVVVVVLPPEPPEVGALYSEISSGPLHPGSARSTRPSPSSSLRFEQAGRAAVVGALTWALPTVIEVAVPAAIIARAAPKAMVTRSFLVIWLADPGPRTWVCWSRPPRTRRHAGRY